MIQIGVTIAPTKRLDICQHFHLAAQQNTQKNIVEEHSLW